MTSERTDSGSPTFEEVSRFKGAVFEVLAFGASVTGIVALAALLVYVAIDAFDLANASPAWLLTYFLLVVCPYLTFCLYSAGDRELVRRTVAVLVGGLVVIAVGFTAMEALVRPIPRLNWQLAYLFVVVVPATGYVTIVGGREPVGRVGFGLLARLVGGTALGLALVILFLVFDPELWFRAYTLGVLPAVLAVAYGRAHPGSPVSTLAIPIGIVGVAIAVLVEDGLWVPASTAGIYAWSVSVPIVAVGAWLIADQRGRTSGVVAGGLLFAGVLSGSLAAGAVGFPADSAILVIAATITPTAVFIDRILESGDGIVGLALPAVLGGGALVAATIVGVFGLPAPDPWLDLAYVTSPPSRQPAQAGLYPAIVGSVIIIAIVAVLSFVLGVGTAVFLEEYIAGSSLSGTITRVIQINVANLAAVPSVVYGLLGLGLFANLLGLGFGTAVTAALTLSLLILPITVISAQEAVRAVPDDLRRGSYAMGATRWQTAKNVVLPEALPGILTGTILSLGRAIGETAPLIMIGAATTVFSPPNSVWSKFSAMPMQIYAWSDFPQEEFRYGVVAAGVVTLLIILLGMNATAIILRNRTERGV